ncbi:hypothetical protein TorRG33x02_120720 [Trema orientale]|uniref:Uncharacterized protein n=1 Tax=Trema orientale TaxID=63057 RepID=A0A2P5F376_TREOI|nr:hypothetical protein TorRG33x02_120720 [Trema orientale]
MRRNALSSLLCPWDLMGRPITFKSPRLLVQPILPLDLPNGLLMLDFDIEVTCRKLVVGKYRGGLNGGWACDFGGCLAMLGDETLDFSREDLLFPVAQLVVVTSGGVSSKVGEQPHQSSGPGSTMSAGYS